MSERYDGFANWATWNVCLWFDNVQIVHLAVRDVCRCSLHPDIAVEAFVRSMWKSWGDFRADVSASELNEVDWKEVAEHFTAE